MQDKLNKFENIANKIAHSDNSNLNNYAIVQKPITPQPQKPSVDHLEGEITKYLGSNG